MNSFNRENDLFFKHQVNWIQSTKTESHTMYLIELEILQLERI